MSTDTHDEIKQKRDDSQTMLVDFKVTCDNSTFKCIQLNQDISSFTEAKWVFEWSNNSCSYDSIFSILYCLFETSSVMWNSTLSTSNTMLTLLSTLFTKIDQGELSAMQARDCMRKELHSVDSLAFPLAPNIGTDMIGLSKELLKENTKYFFRRDKCLKCNTTQDYVHDRHENSQSWLLQISSDQWKNYRGRGSECEFKKTTE